VLGQGVQFVMKYLVFVLGFLKVYNLGIQTGIGSIYICTSSLLHLHICNWISFFTSVSYVQCTISYCSRHILIYVVWFLLIFFDPLTEYIVCITMYIFHVHARLCSMQGLTLV
jgi:hypothetical protein